MNIWKEDKDIRKMRGLSQNERRPNTKRIILTAAGSTPESAVGMSFRCETGERTVCTERDGCNMRELGIRQRIS